jgi:Asp/Glu/hydantoin racemase
VLQVLLVGPTSAPWEEVADELEADLARLRRPGIALSYRCTGAGPRAIRSRADLVEAAPHVVRTVVAAAGEGFDAVIVDCTDDPGVVAARALVTIPVIGAGEGLRIALSTSPRPVRLITGDDLRAMTPDELAERARGAATVALGATGYFQLVEPLKAIDGVRLVVDPLDAALERASKRCTEPEASERQRGGVRRVAAAVSQALLTASG